MLITRTSCKHQSLTATIPLHPTKKRSDLPHPHLFLLLALGILITRYLGVLPLCLFHESGEGVVFDGGDCFGLEAHRNRTKYQFLQDNLIAGKAALTLMATFICPSNFSISSPILTIAFSINSIAAFLSVLVVLITYNGGATNLILIGTCSVDNASPARRADFIPLMPS